MLSHFSHIQLFATPWTVACQPPLAIGFSRQKYWTGLPCSLPGDLPDPGIKPVPFICPAVAGVFFTTSTPGKPCLIINTLKQVSPFLLLLLQSVPTQRPKEYLENAHPNRSLPSDGSPLNVCGATITQAHLCWAGSSHSMLTTALYSTNGQLGRMPAVTGLVCGPRALTGDLQRPASASPRSSSSYPPLPSRLQPHEPLQHPSSLRHSLQPQGLHVQCSSPWSAIPTFLTWLTLSPSRAPSKCHLIKEDLCFNITALLLLLLLLSRFSRVRLCATP